jgi:hypothetical protein
MLMNEDDLSAYRLSWRIALIERLVLMLALFQPVSAGKSSLEQSRKQLKEWLDSHSAIVDSAYGDILRDPAMAALHADEVRDVIAQMKAIVDRLADPSNRRT